MPRESGQCPLTSPHPHPPHGARMITPTGQRGPEAVRAPIPCPGRHDGWWVSRRVRGENDTWVAERSDLGTCASQALFLTVWPRDPRPRHRLGSV